MKISAVICTCNREHAVLNCLNSVAKALETAEIKDSEIIIVNNASKDNTAQLLEDWSKTVNFETKIVFEDKQGIGYARNAGLNAVTGDLIACIDDDCIMDSNYIIDMIKPFSEDRDLCMRGGRVELGDPADLPLSIKTYNQKQTWKKPMTKAEEGKLLGDAIIGCNFAMQREVFEKVGEFDTTIGAGTPIPGGEDTDYFYRAYLNDVKIEYVPDMFIHHFHGRRTDAQRIKLLTNYAIGNGAISYKYLFIHPAFAGHIKWQTISCFKRWRKMYQDKSYKPSIHPMAELKAFYKGIFYYIFCRRKQA